MKVKDFLNKMGFEYWEFAGFDTENQDIVVVFDNDILYDIAEVRLNKEGQVFVEINLGDIIDE